MKKEVIKLAEYYGCTTSYSGKSRTMYIHGDNAKDAVVAIKAQFHTRFDVVED